MFSLTTPRLHLRELVSEDFDSLFAILSDPETMRFYPSPYSADGVKDWLDRNLQRYRDWGHSLWAVELRQTGEFVGQCGITYQSINNQSLPEIGYQFNRQFWGNGYATEAAWACLEYGFEQLEFDEIFIHTYVKNIPSQKVAERLGMNKLNVFDKDLTSFEPGLVWPHVVYSMTKSEFAQKDRENSIE